MMEMDSRMTAYIEKSSRQASGVHHVPLNKERTLKPTRMGTMMEMYSRMTACITSQRLRKAQSGDMTHAPPDSSITARSSTASSSRSSSVLNTCGSIRKHQQRGDVQTRAGVSRWVWVYDGEAHRAPYAT
jgi:hypothetical protein